jgi:type IV pilus assembly protein PilE
MRAQVTRRPVAPAHGFTLIELVIVVMIIGFITAIALPSYTAYVKRGQRADARSQLAQAAQWVQRFYAANDSYSTARDGNAIALPDRLKQAPAEGTPLYQLDAGNSVFNATDFKLVFRPVNNMAGDKCGSFTLDNTGAKGVTGNTASRDECWR